MTTPHDPTRSYSPLDAAIAAYLQAVEAGDVPNRQEMIDRHPDLADGLRAFFADLDRVDRVAAPLRLAGDPDATGAAEGPSTAARPTIRYFGDYELLEEVARGGMGVVFKARQASLNRIVALKLILAGALASAREVQRFRAEAEAAANLDHPHIVPIYEVGEHDGQQYYAMKFVEGTSLAKHPRGDARAEVAGLVDVARAVHHAHQHGVLHRDLKPSNVLVDPQGVRYVADFGLAKRLADAGGSLTESGAVLGTPRYMSPEQAAGRKDLTVAADVYGLGVILYERLTGRTPFEGDNVVTVLRRVREAEPPRPSAIRPGLDRDLETVVLKCLDKEPSRRYASAEALADDLANWLAGRPIAARPVGQAERFWRWCKRNPAVAGLTTAVAVLLLVGIAISTYFTMRANDSALQAAADKRIAEQNAAEADARAEGERREKDLARRNLYLAHMQLAQSAWEDANMERLQSLVNLYRQLAPGETELRAFEWHYLIRLPQLDLRTMGPNPPKWRGYYDPNVAFSPDGRHVATASPEGGIRIWDVGTGQVVTTLGDRRADFRGVAFSPDGKQIAGITCFSGSLHLWDIVSGNEIRTLKAYSAPERIGSGDAAVVFSPDGKLLASLVKSDLVKGHSEVRMWDTETAKELLFFRGPGKERVDSMVFSPDGRRLATGSGLSTAIHILDSGTGQKLMTLQGPAVGAAHTIAISPDGQRIAAPASDGVIKIWDANTSKPLVTFRGHTGSVSSVAFSPDGRRLASGGWDRTVRVWDASSGAELLTLRGHTGGVNDGVSGLAFSPDGWRLASVSRSGIVKLWNSITSQEAYELPGHNDRLTCVAFSPDGRRLASASLDRTVRVRDAVTGRVALTLRGPAWVTGVAFSPDGRRLAAVGDKGFVKVWDAVTGKDLTTFIGHKDRVWGVSFSPDGRLLATAGGDKTVRVWDLASRQEVWTLEGHKRYVLSAAFSPDGQRLASASWDDTVRVWDLANGKEVFTLKGHTDSVSVVAYSPDGRFIASGSDDRTIRFWHAATGQDARVFRGHTGIVRGLAFSPDGRRLVSASGDNTVKLWDTSTGEEILTLGGRSGDWISVAVSPDGTRIALATSLDRKVKVWEALPLTPDTKARLEARGLIQFLFGKGPPRDRVLGVVRDDVTISVAVRQEAIALAEHWQPDIDAMALNNESWATVHRPDAEPEQYKVALQQAETICRLDPENGFYLNTLGVAQYRMGQYQEAIDTLLHADRINNGIPADLAFLAMAQHQLGEKEQAKATLARLRQIMEKSKQEVEEETKAFLREAEALLAKPGGRPAEKNKPGNSNP